MLNSCFLKVSSRGRENLTSQSSQNDSDFYDPFWRSELFLLVQLADATTRVQLIFPLKIVTFQYSVDVFLKGTNYPLYESNYLVILDKKK